MMPVFCFITVSKNLEKWHLALWRVLDIYKCGAPITPQNRSLRSRFCRAPDPARRNQAPAGKRGKVGVKRAAKAGPRLGASPLNRLGTSPIVVAPDAFWRASFFTRSNPFLAFCSAGCAMDLNGFCIDVLFYIKNAKIFSRFVTPLTFLLFVLW